MINVLFLFTCLVVLVSGHQFDRMQSTLIQDMELESELNLINKVPIKSIHTEFGYIVDCIDINNQPAFSHPLLKNHKLQRHPSLRTTIENKRKNSVKTSSTKAMFGLKKIRCPIGSVPIRRTTKDDLIRGKSYFNNGLVGRVHGNHYAEVISDPHRFESYNGVYGSTSVYSLNVKKGQSSSSVMYIRNGPDSTSYIGMGWHVVPELYNDDATHFYAVWTADNFKNTGCFNILCPGFVQISRNYLGGRISNTSIYGGHTFEMRYGISQDPTTKNWLLFNADEMIGYFPASLFPNMAYAHQVGWGGRTSNTQGGPSPPMGSGYFPNGVFDESCYFRNIAFQRNSTEIITPFVPDVKEVNDKPKCFYVKYYGLRPVVGYSLQYGGPGGNCGD